MMSMSGFDHEEGHCVRSYQAGTGRRKKKSGGLSDCRVSQRCQEEDINSVCVGAGGGGGGGEGSVGRCQCRDDMNLNAW